MKDLWDLKCQRARERARERCTSEIRPDNEPESENEPGARYPKNAPDTLRFHARERARENELEIEPDNVAVSRFALKDEC